MPAALKWIGLVSCLYLAAGFVHPSSKDLPTRMDAMVLSGKEASSPAEEASIPESDQGEAVSEDTAGGSHDTVTKEVSLSGPSGDEPVVMDHPSNVLVLVNKNRQLPPDYVPEDLVEPQVPFSFTGQDEKRLMRKEAAVALEKLFQAAQAEGLDLYAQSGYRSYARQEAIFSYNAAKKGAEVANQTSAYPGESEHQTGLAMDVTSPLIQFALETSFADTPEGQWVAENASKYGFVIRYPEGKEDITGYTFEPWHLRYVGLKAAKEMTQRRVTLEEYLLDLR